MDTGKEHEYYYIHVSLWLSVVGSKKGMLCIGCLENRLGRVLTPGDFTNAYINDVGFAPKSMRLMERIYGTGNFRGNEGLHPV
jgi:hypothetical protein